MRSLIMIGMLLLSTGCASMGMGGDYYIDQRALDRANKTMDNWFAQDRPQEQPKVCRTYDFKGMYGEMEKRTVCQ